ncbi:hypothetical protein BOTBODRAFT_35529 [Botryobasidium botryosum FD-172 SS1]|uniref:Uncharacterized protein n=1 Tax=Botryobasidium botryosum (strain FD-172 SS1) TaxID=930990 RepID=A0A067M951_BOTB1|nr:hypothetical protein BOTBODRAFT_35529 [Botryobasidium botryosum FD-172 SS1]
MPRRRKSRVANLGEYAMPGVPRKRALEEEDKESVWKSRLSITNFVGLTRKFSTDTSQPSARHHYTPLQPFSPPYKPAMRPQTANTNGPLRPQLWFHSLPPPKTLPNRR